MDRISARATAALLGDLTEDGQPLHAALATRVRHLIGDGRLPVGVRLPPERELAAAAGLSRSTVTTAYGRLRAAGWTTARQGAGTWTALPAGARSGPWVPSPADDGVLDLAHAAPRAAPQVAAALAAAVDQLPRLLPGHGYSPAGLPELRARIADRFTERGLPTTPEQVLVTAGALHGVHVALQAVLRRGARLLVDAPTYPNALDAARAVGLRLLPVALDSARPQDWLERVERTLTEASPSGAYLVPDFHNPTGLLLDDAGRARLARALRRAGTVPVVDETLVELGLDAVPGTPLGALVDGVTVGSLSKAFWGGLRIGWVRADPTLVPSLAAALQTAHMSSPAVEQLAACVLLEGAEASLSASRQRLRAQREVLLAELAAQLPDWQVDRPAGGLVLWCRLPSARSTRLVQEAGQRGLRLVAGPRFGTGHAFEDRLRLPYTGSPEVLRRAVRILVEADAAATARPRRAAVV